MSHPLRRQRDSNCDIGMRRRYCGARDGVGTAKRGSFAVYEFASPLSHDPTEPRAYPSVLPCVSPTGDHDRWAGCWPSRSLAARPLAPRVFIPAEAPAPHGRLAVWHVTRRESRVSDAPSMLLGCVGTR